MAPAIPKHDFDKVQELEEGGIGKRRARSYQERKKVQMINEELDGAVKADDGSECGRGKGYVEEGMECDSCRRWFHMQCELVSQRNIRGSQMWAIQ